MDSLKFHPSEEELITHHLWRKMDNRSFSIPAIDEADRKLDPWDFPGVSFQQGERKEWFFFSPRDWMNGIYRVTYSGYWKTTGKDTEIFKGKALLGMKRTMVFYQGKIPKITKTNWLMHEYRSESNHEWVICKVFLMENKMEEISGICSSEESKPSSMMQTNSISTQAPQPQDTTGLLVKLKYKEDTVKFVLNNPTMDGLKTQVLKRFNKLDTHALKFKYRDLGGEMITIICDEDLQLCLQSFKSFGRIEVTMSLAS
ncbi:PREDICTED: NAC domain-containing protein 92-like [Ipomoea nil]|uniref:NAC domain-containing protein 92-like n=1 Tax=Ipomoea nil TaxID=35883 RepID=UPI0009017592|nr:PREDICTED: NAC domain-containing protein 92-like [Ipomoea nil]